jgi:hypothetical protein
MTKQRQWKALSALFLRDWEFPTHTPRGHSHA